MVTFITLGILIAIFTLKSIKKLTMKITFTGQYKDVIRNVQEQISPEKAPSGEFKALLSDLIKPLQVSEITDDTHTSTINKPGASKGSLIKFNFAEPTLDPPSIVQQSTNITSKASVNLSSLEVKPPVLVEAKRVPSLKVSQLSLEERSEIRDLVQKAGHKLGIDPALSLAVARAESSFNPKAISSDGHASKGLFQLLDSTGKDLHNKLDIHGRYDPFNPTMNADLGVNYLRYLHDIFSKETPLPNSLSTIAAANSTSLEKLAVAAFNAGEGRVASAQARAKASGKNPSEYHEVEPYLPESTQDYVSKVLEFRSSFEAAVDG